MGLFDQFKQAFTKENLQQGLSAGFQSAGESLRNPQGAMADAAAVNAFGQELRRIRENGLQGECTMRALHDTSEPAPAGNDWKVLAAEIRLPGREPYVASMRQLVPRGFEEQYATGKVYKVAVDPNDPNRFAFLG